jgi:membrane protease YdiL (CAAX protease family)
MMSLVPSLEVGFVVLYEPVVRVRLLAYKVMMTRSVPRLSVGLLLIGAVLGYVGGQIVASLLIVAVAALQHQSHLATILSASKAPWWVTIGGFVGLWAGMLGTVRWGKRFDALRWPTGTWRLSGLTDLLYVAGGIVLQLVVDAGYAPFHLRGLNHPITHLFGAAHGVTFVLIAVLTVIGAPIVEESFFRGFLYRGLATLWRESWRGRGLWLAAVASGLLFGLAHGELLQLPGLTLVGIVLARVYERTQRLLPSVLVHVGFNSLTVVALLTQRLGHA